MPQTCKRCRRANPREAIYCYRDGNLLDHPVGGDIPADGSAMNIGSRPFSIPLVFPTGETCHNFVQLSLTCQENPAAAMELLTKGHLETFLAGQGRTDLADAAHAAARAANRERGLDEFLSRLPVPLKPAKLRVERALIDLGMVRVGDDRRFELVLLNSGERLVSGMAHCEVDWLSLGNGPASQSRVFQFSSKSTLSVRVDGNRLRAFTEPRETEIVLESNGGAVTVMVRVTVPVRPFPEGVLSGAISPRQMAVKVKEAPKEAAVLIESGAVSRWYQVNGWTYPVLGPTATGIAAVQQLFEALGIVKPPRVELSEDAIYLQGRPGEKLEYSLAVITHENRAAIAHGISDQAWLDVGCTIFRGRSAFLPLTVAAVPADSSASLQAMVEVIANGGQRFTVPVTLVISGAPAPRTAPKVARNAREAHPTPLSAAAPVARPAAPATPVPRLSMPTTPSAGPWDTHQIVRWLLVLVCAIAFGALLILGWYLWHQENEMGPAPPAPAPGQQQPLP